MSLEGCWVNLTTNKGVQEVRNKREKGTKETCNVIDTPSDNVTSMATLLFDWANDINTHLEGMNTASLISSVPIPPPCDLSALCLGTQDPWGTLSCHHHCNHHPQPPRSPSAPRLATQDSWGSISYCHRCFNPAWKTVHSRPAWELNLYLCPLEQHLPLLPHDLHQPAEP